MVTRLPEILYVNEIFATYDLPNTIVTPSDIPDVAEVNLSVLLTLALADLVYTLPLSTFLDCCA
mgnify:FL=1|jgi:hypothetical protein